MMSVFQVCDRETGECGCSAGGECQIDSDCQSAGEPTATCSGPTGNGVCECKQDVSDIYF